MASTVAGARSRTRVEWTCPAGRIDLQRAAGGKPAGEPRPVVEPRGDRVSLTRGDRRLEVFAVPAARLLERHRVRLLQADEEPSVGRSHVGESGPFQGLVRPVPRPIFTHRQPSS